MNAPAAPFVGVRPFEFGDRDIFFGRRRDAELVRNLVVAVPLVTVFAPSGTGKSSLLRAGLIPLLEGRRNVCVIDDWRTSLLEQFGGWAGLDVSSDSTLLKLAEAYEARAGIRPLLILDQFEEWSRTARPDNVSWAQLAQVANTPGGPLGVVISIREDYLGSLDPLMGRVPGLLEGRFKVDPLTRSDLELAVDKPLDSFRYEAEPALIDAVFEYLDEQRRHSVVDDRRLEPGYFQLIWEALWDERHRVPGHTLTRALFDRMGGGTSIVESFVGTAIDSVLDEHGGQLLYGITRYLVLPSGAKLAMSVEDVAAQVRTSDFTSNTQVDDAFWMWVGNPDRDDEPPIVSPESVEEVLQALATSAAPVFRRVDSGDRTQYELVHDLLGPILRNWRDEFARRWERSLAEADARVAAVASKRVELESQLSEASRVYRPGDMRSEQAYKEVAQTVANLAPTVGSATLLDQATSALEELSSTGSSDRLRRQASRAAATASRDAVYVAQLPPWAVSSLGQSPLEYGSPPGAASPSIYGGDRRTILRTIPSWLLLCAATVLPLFELARVLTEGLRTGSIGWEWIPALALILVWTWLYAYDQSDNAVIVVRPLAAIAGGPMSLLYRVFAPAFRPLTFSFGWEKLATYPVHFVVPITAGYTASGPLAAVVPGSTTLWFMIVFALAALIMIGFYVSVEILF